MKSALKRVKNQALAIAESYLLQATGQNKTLQQKRLEVCRGNEDTQPCPMYGPILGSCSHCGCPNIGAKASNPSMHCPEGKW